MASHQFRRGREFLGRLESAGFQFFIGRRPGAVPVRKSSTAPAPIHFCHAAVFWVGAPRARCCGERDYFGVELKYSPGIQRCRSRLNSHAGAPGSAGGFGNAPPPGFAFPRKSRTPQLREIHPETFISYLQQIDHLGDRSLHLRALHISSDGTFCCCVRDP